MDTNHPSILDDEAGLGKNLKQPRQLYMLFMTEMWERFTFYGMKAILLVYMTTYLLYDDSKGNLILGAYMALVYAMPLFGGRIADTILGYRKAIVFGGILMAIGNFTLAVNDNMTFFLGMSFIIVGNGFFKPNISSIVGSLYKPNDPRRDSGFSIFYMGINVGAALGSVLCGWLGQTYSWSLGFGVAGVFMILGLIIFTTQQKTLGEKGLPPSPEKIKSKSFIGISNETTVYLGGLLAIPAMVGLLSIYNLMGYILLPFAGIALIYILYMASKLEKDARTKMWAAVVMILFSVLFWGFFEQGGQSLNLFTLRNVELHGLPSTAVNNFINPFFIVVFSIVFANLWIWLAKRGKEPSTPVKFGLGFLQLGLGFFIFALGGNFANEGLVPIIFLIGGYLLLSTGELCLSPIGLSMVTKLSPMRLTGMMMGFWFLASALGQYVAGVVGALLAVPTEGGEASLPATESLAIYTGGYQQIFYICIGAGVVILLISPFIRKWMKDVH